MNRGSHKTYMSQVMYFVIFRVENGKTITRIYGDMAPWVEARIKAYKAMELLRPGDSLRIFGNGCLIEEWKK